MTIYQIHKKITKSLEEISDNACLEADMILEHVLGMDRTHVYLNNQKSISSTNVKKIDEIIAQRIKHKPLQYIIGHKWFYNNRFTVNVHTFIPRSDTEILVEQALKSIRKQLDILINLPLERGNLTNNGTYRVLDLCTGSGAILISILHSLLTEKFFEKYGNLKFEFIGIDISKEALGIAGKNKENILAKLPRNVSCEFIKSDLFKNIEGKFDLIVSNPPYIPETDKPGWQKELNFEPQIALTSGLDGMDAYNTIINILPGFLKSHGIFLGEIHPENYDKLRELAHENSFQISSINGLSSEPRFIVLQPKPNTQE